MRITTALLVASLVWVPCLTAQSRDVRVGTRVRVRSDGETVVGTVTRLAGDSVVVTSADSLHCVTLQLANRDRIQVVAGQRRNTGRGLVLGTLLGGGAGMAIGYLAGDSPCNSPTPNAFFGGCGLFWRAEDKAAIGGVVLGVLGAVSGTVIGFSKKSERWVSAAPTAVAVSPLIDGRRVGLSLRF